MTPWAGFRSTLVSRGCLLLSSGVLTSCHVVFVFHVFPHAFGLSFYMEAVFEVTYKHQPQMIVDVIVHGHVVADQVDVQRAITFAECLLLIPHVTSGDLADCIMGEKAGKSCHNLGVVSINIIGCDDLFHHGHLKHIYNKQGWSSAFLHGCAWQHLQSVISLLPGGTRVLTVMLKKVGDVMYTQTSRLIVVKHLSNIIGMVLIIMRRWIVQDDPFPLPVGLHTWQVGCPFISTLALAFLNLFLCRLRVELPTQVFGFTAIRVWRVFLDFGIFLVVFLEDFLEPQDLASVTSGLLPGSHLALLLGGYTFLQSESLSLLASLT